MKTNRKHHILVYIRGGKSVSKACKRFQISRATFYRWLKEDSIFRAEYKLAGMEIARNMPDFLSRIASLFFKIKP